VFIDVFISQWGWGGTPPWKDWMDQYDVELVSQNLKQQILAWYATSLQLLWVAL
jgi:hypothetical protein